MKITVKQEFGGRVTKERRVLPGTYDVNDLPGGKATADEMLLSGFAVVADDAPPPPDNPPAEDVPIVQAEPESDESESAEAEQPKRRRSRKATKDESDSE